MRQIAPISSALHLGAECILVVGVGHGASEDDSETFQDRQLPFSGRDRRTCTDSIFIDGLEVDLERLRRINRTMKMIPDDLRNKTNL